MLIDLKKIVKCSSSWIFFFVLQVAESAHWQPQTRISPQSNTAWKKRLRWRDIGVGFTLNEPRSDLAAANEGQCWCWAPEWRHTSTRNKCSACSPQSAGQERARARSCTWWWAPPPTAAVARRAAARRRRIPPSPRANAGLRGAGRRGATTGGGWGGRGGPWGGGRRCAAAGRGRRRLGWG